MVTKITASAQVLHAIPKRFYCKDAPLSAQIRYAIWGREGLTEKQQSDVPKVIHKFVLKQNANNMHISALKAMEWISAFKSPLTKGHLYVHEFYRSYPQGVGELRRSFATSGKQMLEKGNLILALPLLLQAVALSGLITCFNRETLALWNCLEIAQLCQNEDTNFREFDRVFGHLIEQGKKINLPEEHIAAMLRNRAACRIFDYCLTQNKSVLSFQIDSMDAAKDFYLEANEIDPKSYSLKIDVDSILELDAIEKIQGDKITGHIQYVWDEFPYVDIPGTLRAFKLKKPPGVSDWKPGLPR